MKKIKGGKDRTITEPGKREIKIHTDKDKNLKQIDIPSTDGLDDIHVKVETVEAKPNELAILPDAIVEGLMMRRTFRMIGTMLDQKIPLYESESSRMDSQEDASKKYAPETPRIYITKYDLIASPEQNLFEKKIWCIYIEKEICGKMIKGGTYFSDSILECENTLDAVARIQDLICQVLGYMNRKYGN